MQGQCDGCGSTRLDKCAIEGAARRLEKSSTIKEVFSTGMIIHADVCMACGRIGPWRPIRRPLAKALE